MLPREVRTWRQPPCPTRLDHARAGELGHRGEVREQKARHRQWVETARLPTSGSAGRDARANLAPTMNDRSQIPTRYPICSPVTTAIATNAIDQTSSARAIPAASVPPRARLITGTRMRTLNH